MTQLERNKRYRDRQRQRGLKSPEVWLSANVVMHMKMVASIKQISLGELIEDVWDLYTNYWKINE